MSLRIIQEFRSTLIQSWELYHVRFSEFSSWWTKLPNSVVNSDSIEKMKILDNFKNLQQVNWTRHFRALMPFLVSSRNKYQ